MAGDTLAVYTSDHGDMMGERGLWFKGLAYEPSVKVPLILAGPGVPAGRRSAEVASHLDLATTLPALCGLTSVCDRTDGRDLSDLVRGGRADGPGRAVIEYYAEGVRRGWRAVRRGDWKLVLCPAGGPELYNLRDDPGEWHNRAGEAACAAELADLEAALREGWEPERLDEMRHQSEERRLAILRAVGQGNPREWQTPSPSPPHPLGFR
jgi:choline-sulfatase